MPRGIVLNVPTLVEAAVRRGDLSMAVQLCRQAGIPYPACLVTALALAGKLN
jgi:hypothetical protein